MSCCYICCYLASQADPRRFKRVIHLHMPPGESHVSPISKEYYFNSSHRELGPPVSKIMFLCCVWDAILFYMKSRPSVATSFPAENCPCKNQSGRPIWRPYMCARIKARFITHNSTQAYQLLKKTQDAKTKLGLRSPSSNATSTTNSWCFGSSTKLIGNQFSVGDVNKVTIAGGSCFIIVSGLLNSQLSSLRWNEDTRFKANCESQVIVSINYGQVNKQNKAKLCKKSERLMIT